MSNAVATTQEVSLPAEAPRNEATAIIQVIERAAMNPDVDIDKMERLLQMQERVMDRQATMDFNAAMAAMQAEMPSITERGKIEVKGVIRSHYATLEDIVDTVKLFLQKHGFAISFRVRTGQNAIEVTGVLMHKSGHREETSMHLPFDQSGSKNNVQSYGSSVSYGKRYVMSALLNITTRGEDDDGNSAEPSRTISAFQTGQLARTVASCSASVQEWFEGKYGDPSNVPAADFDGIMKTLNRRLAEARKEKEGEPNKEPEQ